MPLHDFCSFLDAVLLKMDCGVCECDSQFQSWVSKRSHLQKPTCTKKGQEKHTRRYFYDFALHLDVGSCPKIIQYIFFLVMVLGKVWKFIPNSYPVLHVLTYDSRLGRRLPPVRPLCACERQRRMLGICGESREIYTQFCLTQIFLLPSVWSIYEH